MTDPSQQPPWPAPGPQRPTVSGLGIVLGMFVLPVPVLTAFFWLLANVGGAFATVLVVMSVIGGIAMVVSKSAFWRGVGVGFLVTAAVCIVLIGSCLAILANIE